MSKKDDYPEVTPEVIEAYRQRLNEQLTNPSELFFQTLVDRMAKCEKDIDRLMLKMFDDVVVDEALAAEKDDAKDGC